jgi:hypothetical protein
MPIVVVGGSGRGVGKTSLVCAILSALPEFGWTALKVTHHMHGRRQTIWEETEPGPGTDTARFLAAGARHAFLVTAPEDDLPLLGIAAALSSHANLIFESNRMAEAIEPDLCIGVIDWPGNETKPSFEIFLKRADAFVIFAQGDIGRLPQAPSTATIFRLNQPDRISPEMLDWLRERLISSRIAE